MSIQAKRLLARLGSIIDQLEVDAKQVDNLVQSQSQLTEEHHRFFSLQLFSTKGKLYSPYVVEIKSLFIKLPNLLSHDSKMPAEAAIEKIEQQIAALSTALASFKLQKKNEQFFTKQEKKQRYKKYTQTLLQPTHDLYQQLAETHEFERRLLLMLEEKQQALNTSSEAKRQAKQQEVLVVHQRLGRCRQAISKIERQIEMAEKKAPGAR